jgi:DNA-directed RNA polymerase subunit beta
VRSSNYSDNIMRRSFSERDDETLIPHLISLETDSFSSFLQKDNSKTRKATGLQRVFDSFFPLVDTNKTISLDFVKYRVDEPRYEEKECLSSGKSYAVSLYATLRLIVWNKESNNKDNSTNREIKVIKEQEVYLCDMPMMTKNGSFIINGAERVIVSQMRRAPGIFFDSEDIKTMHKKSYKAKIIPLSGSWIDFEFDNKDVIYFRINRKRKIPAASLLRAMGMSTEEIIRYFYKEVELFYAKKGWSVDFNYDRVLGRRFEYDILDADSGKIVIEKNTKITKNILKELKESGFEKYLINDNNIFEYILSEDIMDNATGEVLLSSGSAITSEKLEVFQKLGFTKIKAVNPKDSQIGYYIYNTLVNDKNKEFKDALFEIYKSVKISENTASVEQVEKFFNTLLFSNRFNLSNVGRMKMNHRLGLSIPLDILHLTKEDLLTTLKVLCKIKHNEEKTDDIDNLANRRVRAVGELLENQFRVGLIRLQRSIEEKLNSIDPETVMPQNVINAKPLISAINDFFATSQLSQFMDQTNPLSEISHKRRLSALGPGGLTRERAGFEVRDVHPTHYGRICPVETPEGQNIGLINSLALYARVNEYGFVETPYRKVKDGIVQDEIVYLSALEESGFAIAQAKVEIDKKGKIQSELVSCRKDGEYLKLPPNEIAFIDVSPKQLVSVATTLLPFLENDDAKRTLMGSNMMKQAVPLLISEAPLIGTGMEKIVAMDCGATIKAKNDGVVRLVDASRIIIEKFNKDSISNIDIYNLTKFLRTNNDTTINQNPVVDVGQSVKAGDIIASGQSIANGELALGKNTLIAFMSWDGYNYEDSVLISERLVKDDVFTSIHIEEFEVVARDTRLGPEEITRDIPNVGEEVLKKLDETGIIHIGAQVKSGDIMVGKTTPKSESPATPEEKLLKVIFGEKAADVKDSSLYVKPGISNGVVIDVRVFTRAGLEKDERSAYIEIQNIEKLSDIRNQKLTILRENLYSQITDLVVNHKVEKTIKDLKKGVKLTKAILKDLPSHLLPKSVVDNVEVMEKIETLNKGFKEKQMLFEEEFNSEVVKIKQGDDLGQGVLKIVKVLVATKRRLQVGDKMAGRHGNKGVISRVLPIEDMPYLDDGTPVDMVLNPLGVPSRMNIGQILETHLGWASMALGKQVAEMLDNISKKKKESIEVLRKKLLNIYTCKKQSDKIKALDEKELLTFAEKVQNGVPFATGIFEDIKVGDIEKIMNNAGVASSGQVMLKDGRNGEYFDRPVTIGCMYMLKLHHLVENKIHARSIGPYSLITQQPLGGKSHFGGQRFGEMECWALQAYGAAYTLQEMLTIKSDDVIGRIKIYESIIQGNQNFSCGIPESFNVMVKEVRSLCLNIELTNE